jgi:aprataxin
MNKKNFPDYNPPVVLLGTPDPSSFWNQALKQYKTHGHDKRWVYDYSISPKATVIYDRFPKSRIHLLVLPMDVNVNSPSEFNGSHLNRLIEVHNYASQLVYYLAKKYNTQFIMGYHAIPSMKDLHLHIISVDFDSIFLKKKQHYNSFTIPDYFISPHKIELDLINYGYVQINTALKVTLKQEPVCIFCTQKIQVTSAIEFKKFKEHLELHIEDITRTKIHKSLLTSIH